MVRGVHPPPASCVVLSLIFSFRPRSGEGAGRTAVPCVHAARVCVYVYVYVCVWAWACSVTLQVHSLPNVVTLDGESVTDLDRDLAVMVEERAAPSAVPPGVCATRPRACLHCLLRPPPQPTHSRLILSPFVADVSGNAWPIFLAPAPPPPLLPSQCVPGVPPSPSFATHQCGVGPCVPCDLTPSGLLLLLWIVPGVLRAMWRAAEFVRPTTAPAPSALGSKRA